MYFNDYFNRKYIFEIVRNVRKDLSYARNKAVRFARWIFEGGTRPYDLTPVDEDFLMRYNYYLPFFDLSFNRPDKFDSFTPIIVPLSNKSREELGDKASGIYKFERLCPSSGEEFLIRQENSSFWESPSNYSHLTDKEILNKQDNFLLKLDGVSKRSALEMDKAVQNRMDNIKDRKRIRSDIKLKLNRAENSYRAYAKQGDRIRAMESYDKASKLFKLLNPYMHYDLLDK